MERDLYSPALSKTAKYKKITKPLLERKRRARINRCLDELKDLMVGALEIDDENISKLEKADILELTVNHLTKLQAPKDPVLEAKKFQAGFGQCAAEACRYILTVPELEPKVSEVLYNHLSRLVTSDELPPSAIRTGTPTSPPISRQSQSYHTDYDRSSSEPEEDIHPDNASQYSVSTTASYNMPHAALMSPMTGLISTIDRISNDQGYQNELYQKRPRQPESKDEILAKIREHIMYKRNNPTNEQQRQDVDVGRSSVIREPETAAPLPRSATTETLDLRKVRTPTKTINDLNRYNVSEKSNIVKVEPVIAESNLEKVELSIDYSNLPPKKKRKLIEYQEMLKRQQELKENPETDPAWRPW